MKVNWLFKNVTVIDGSDCRYGPGAEPAGGAGD